MKIQTKISSIIFILILVTGIIATTSSYIVSKQMIETQIYHHLEDTATFRALHIETLLDEEVELVKTFATSNVFIDVFTSQNLTPAIQRIKALINIHDVISQIRILDKQGKVVISSHSKINPIGNAEMFAHGKEGIYIRDIQISLITGTKVMNISAPILVKGEFVGIMIVSVEVEKELYEITSSDQHRKTGEIYLINKGYMITPSRFMDDTFLKLKVNSLGARECLSTTEPKTEFAQLSIYENYRGELVIGTHRAIKGMDWCLLAEMDAKEAFAPVNRLVQLMVLFFIVLLGMSGIVAFFTAKNITRPIIKLRRRAYEIEKGNWNYQVTVDTQDEIGQFSRAFDSMTTRLKNAKDKLQRYQEHLEKLVEERTADLVLANEYLQQEIGERIQASNALRASEEQVRLLLNSTSEAIFGMDVTGCCTFCNPACVNILGYNSVDDLINQDIHSMIHHSKLDGSPICEKGCLVYQSIKQGKETHCDGERFSRADNTSFPIECWAHPILQGDELIGAVVIFIDITERKKAEQALAKSNALLKSVIEQAPFAIQIGEGTTDSWKIMITNKEAQRITGATEEQQRGLGISYGKITHPEKLTWQMLYPEGSPWLPQDVPLSMAMFQGKVTKNAEMIVRRTDGVEHTILCNAAPIYNDKREIIAGVVIYSDMTECKQMENSLRESEQNLRTFFNTINDLFFVLDKNGNIITTNDTVITRLGYCENELIGKSVLQVHPKEKLKEATQTIQNMLMGKEEFCSIPLITKEGKYLSVETRVQQGNWSGEKVLFGVCKDISAIKASEEKFSLAFQMSPSLMAISSLEKGHYIDVNVSFLKVLGYEKREVIGKTSIELGLFTKKHRDKVKKQIELDGFLRNFEMTIQTKDGHLRQGLFSADIIQLQEQKCFLTVMNDITERKQAEIALIQTKEEADAASRAKSEFLANMSHEIRTPMSAVIGFSDMLASEVTDKKQKSYLDSIQTAGKSLLTLINDILDLSKIEAGLLDIQYEPVNPRMIFTELQQIFNIKMAEKNLELIMEIDKSLPPTLILDEIRLRQVLLNLMGNAVKFTESGYIKLCAKAYINNKQIDLILAVEDSGIGISVEQQTVIFESFKQQDGQSTRKYGGTGLGLTITKRLVEMMNGQISVTSVPGKGSRFEVTLREVKMATIAQKVKQDNTFNLNNITFEKVQVMVVDDTESNRYLIKEYLPRVNLEVISAENGQEALQFVKEYHPALILMDIKMPGMNGYEATRHLKDNPNTANIPVIALTASATMEEKAKTETHSFDGYLSKPVNVSKLLSELSRYLKYTRKCVTDAPQIATVDSTLNPVEIAELPELRNKLKQEIMPICKKAIVTTEMELVAELAEKMIKLGKEYYIPIFIRYGETLLESTQTFDIAYIKKALKEFPCFIKPLM